MAPAYEHAKRLLDDEFTEIRPVRNMGDSMTFVERLLKDVSADATLNSDTGVTWEFAFTVTEKMKEAARLRSSRKWKLVQGFSKRGEKASLDETLKSKA
jgi:hypothetical protein